MHACEGGKSGGSAVKCDKGIALGGGKKRGAARSLGSSVDARDAAVLFQQQGRGDGKAGTRGAGRVPPALT